MAIAQLTGANLTSTTLNRRNGMAMLVGHQVLVCSKMLQNRASSVTPMHCEFVNSFYLGTLISIEGGRGPPYCSVKYNVLPFLNPISSIGSLHIMEAK